MASIKSEGVDSRRINLDQILFFPPKTRFRLIRQIRTKNGSLEQEKEGGAETFVRMTFWLTAKIVIRKYAHKVWAEVGSHRWLGAAWDVLSVCLGREQRRIKVKYL